MTAMDGSSVVACLSAVRLDSSLNLPRELDPHLHLLPGSVLFAPHFCWTVRTRRALNLDSSLSRKAARRCSAAHQALHPASPSSGRRRIPVDSSRLSHICYVKVRPLSCQLHALTLLEADILVWLRQKVGTSRDRVWDGRLIIAAGGARPCGWDC